MFATLGQAPSPETETLTIDAISATKPFPHVWEQMFGSGRAILSLRESYRRDLRLTKAITGIQYVRFHGILDDQVGIYRNGSYNFSYLDEIYDGLLANGVRPFVELSFMPRDLSASDKLHAFWYKPYPNPPKDYSRWEDLIYNFTRHCLDRYGEDEVARWYFEVWNEPNIDFWTGEPKQASYFQLYDHAARAVKRASARLRVGGPATAQAAWVDAMIRHCTEAKIPLDFVSTHVYGNDRAQDVFGTDEDIPRSSMVARSVRKVFDQVKASTRPGIPIIWSEYNASYMNEVDVTDSPFMGPWLANNIRQCDGMTTLMSYWTFSDVFEEQGVVPKPFYGGYGLIAAGGIPKAAFNAFSMLHRLGTERIPVASTNALATRKPDGGVAVAIWNYAPPGEAGLPRRFQISTAGLGPSAHYRVTILDRDHGSALTAWQAMGSPAFPARAQQEQLRSAATALGHSNSSTVVLAAHGLALVEVDK